MYSKILQAEDVSDLEVQLDLFLKDLEEVTGQIDNLKIFTSEKKIIVLIIYNCWKKL